MKRLFLSKPLQTICLVTGATTFFAAHQIVKGDPKFYENILMPFTCSLFDSENAHKIAINLTKYGLVPKQKVEYCNLKTKVWGKEFKNPIGVAAGFDKHAEAMEGLNKIGCGFLEVGSITPLPQDGNERPRVFRLTEDKCIINRYGFNSCGHEIAKERIKTWSNSKNTNIILGINLGKNKTTENPFEDYVKGINELGQFADYLVINVSSPNTPGLRKLQGKLILEQLCIKTRRAVNSITKNRPPLLIKIAPDLTEQDVNDIADILNNPNFDINGLIISNTTVSRPDCLQSQFKTEKGGLSGPVLKTMSNDLIGKFYVLTNGKIPIIGVGGVCNGQDAYDKIKQGASLVQLYTSIVYKGPPVINTVKQELSVLLEKDGFASISEAVGINHKNNS